MLKFVKDDKVKLISPESSLIEFLRHEGWVVEGEEVYQAPRRGRPPKEKEVEKEVIE